MYDARVRREAQRRLASGETVSGVARRLSVSRASVRAWRDAVDLPPSCPVCGDTAVDPDGYAALLGYYLGDGCISEAARHFVLRVSCDLLYPGIVEDVERCMRAVRPRGSVFRVAAPGVAVVQSNWKHWPCLFPQHGPGKKHERPIVLEAWQRDLVADHPGPFLRGLFHSDGCRVANWATRVVAGQRRRYDYPRWQFSNRSDDIHALCCWALDLVEVPWRRSGRWTTSVSTRAGVAVLDELVGLKR